MDKSQLSESPKVDGVVILDEEDNRSNEESESDSDSEDDGLDTPDSVSRKSYTLPPESKLNKDEADNVESYRLTVEQDYYVPEEGMKNKSNLS